MPIRVSPTDCAVSAADTLVRIVLPPTRSALRLPPDICSETPIGAARPPPEKRNSACPVIPVPSA